MKRYSQSIDPLCCVDVSDPRRNFDLNRHGDSSLTCRNLHHVQNPEADSGRVAIARINQVKRSSLGST